MPTIVLIDDEPLVRSLARRHLESAGFEVHEAENGLEGVRLSREVLPDLVITDILMPIMDGFTTTAHLRKQFPHMPIITMSGSTDALTVAHCYRTGATHFTPKPLDYFELKETAEAIAAAPVARGEMALPA